MNRIGSDDAFARTRLRFAGRALLATALFPCLTYGRPASAIVFQSFSAESAGLGVGQSFLNAEARLVITFNNNSQAGCSGSLLSGGEYILTAAHCVTGSADELAALAISISFANVGLTLKSSSYVVDPVWNGSLDNGGDLAVVALTNPVTSIAGYLLDTGSSAVGKTVTMAGYGLTGTGSMGATGSFGTLHYGTNYFGGVYADSPSVYYYAFTETGINEVMTGPGDSGGASFLNVSGTWEIVGVHDFIECTTPGCTLNSSFGTFGGDTSIYADAAFLNSVVSEPPTAALLTVGIVAALGSSRRRFMQRSK